MSSIAAIGLMSGTSHDGVDVALIETDGETIERFGPTGYRPYSEEERTLLRRATAAATNLAGRTDRPGPLKTAEALVTEIHAEAVETFLAANDLPASEIAVVGFHGQTVAHDPSRKLTVQLGDGPGLARRLGIPVVCDFRAEDVAAGGEGAPMVPVFHRTLVKLMQMAEPVGVLNLGGVANITYVDGDHLIACDCGPGNALVDDFIRLRTGAPYDADGGAAARGRVDVTAVERALAHPFFTRPAPKSLDRNTFRHWLVEQGTIAGKSTEDGAATLTAITAAGIARTIAMLPRAPASIIVAGGGARNSTLMGMLRHELAPAVVETAADVGWSADALEAQAFAYLAVRCLRGLPLSFPGTTGVPRPMRGGVLANVGRPIAG
jgi:anhydro-N-acetylmuramic acid kinase